MKANITNTYHSGHKLWEQILLRVGSLWGSSSCACCCRTCSGNCGSCGCRNSCCLSSRTGWCICSLCGVWCCWCCWWGWGCTGSTSTIWRQRSKSHTTTINYHMHKKIYIHIICCTPLPHFMKVKKLHVISGFCCSVNKVFGLLECWTVVICS